MSDLGPDADNATLRDVAVRRLTHHDGPWMQTLFGHAMSLPDFGFPDVGAEEGITLREVSWVLSGICRFGVRTGVRYTVAEHAVRVAALVRDLGGSPMDQWRAIHHEGDEALLGFDPPSPLLRVCPDLRRLKRAAHAAYCDRYRLPHELPAVVKEADLVLLATEKRDLMAPEPRPWLPLPDPLPHHVRPLPVDLARRVYVRRWIALAEEVGWGVSEEDRALLRELTARWASEEDPW